MKEENKTPHEAIIKLDNEAFILKKINGEFTIAPSDKLVGVVIDLLWENTKPCRFVLCYNLFIILEDVVSDLSIRRELVNQYRKKLCDAVFSYLNENYANIINPYNLKLIPLEFEIDGYNINKDFGGVGVDFYSTKQLHFDIVEPLSSNLYGLNKNIKNGFPIFADCKSYCVDKGIDVVTIIEKISGSRIITIKREHYINILKRYTVAVNVDMASDTPFSIYINRVKEAGIMHGATDPLPIVASMESSRPIIHYSFDCIDEELTDDWYSDLGLVNSMSKGSISKEKPLFPFLGDGDIEIRTIKINHD